MGRPRGHPRAERRLKRELADKNALIETAGYLRDVAVELIRAAQTSPFIGFVIGLTTVEVLHKAKLIGSFTTNLIVAILGLELAGEAVSELTDLAGAIFGHAANPDHLAELGSKVTVNAPTNNPEGGNTEGWKSTFAALGGIVSKLPEVAVA